MSEENNKQPTENTDVGNKPEATTIIDRADSIVKRLEEAEKRLDEKVARAEQLVARNLLSGKSEAGTAIRPADPEKDENEAWLKQIKSIVQK